VRWRRSSRPIRPISHESRRRGGRSASSTPRPVPTSFGTLPSFTPSRHACARFPRLRRPIRGRGNRGRRETGHGRPARSRGPRRVGIRRDSGWCPAPSPPGWVTG
jgi:hypothetical protein